jgi:F-type H+-transporting ATPase subunit h
MSQNADAHLSSVKSYAAPAAPQAPTLPSDLTAELSKFDATEPVLASASTTADVTTSATAEEGVAGGAKEYLEFLEKDLPKADAHH